MTKEQYKEKIQSMLQSIADEVILRKIYLILVVMTGNA